MQPRVCMHESISALWQRMLNGLAKTCKLHVHAVSQGGTGTPTHSVESM